MVAVTVETLIDPVVAVCPLVVMSMPVAPVASLVVPSQPLNAKEAMN